MDTNYTPENLSKWTRPDSWYGVPWHNYYVFMFQSRDSDVLERCNFKVAVERLSEVPDFEPVLFTDEYGDEEEQESRVVVRESHWAVGWIEWIAIHERDNEGLKAADEMADSLDNYPVLDESLFSEMEMEEGMQVWEKCYDNSDRIDWMRGHKGSYDCESFAQLLSMARGKDFYGHFGELLY